MNIYYTSFTLLQSSNVGTDTLIPGATESHTPTYVPRYLEGQSGVNIQQVACGDLFTACLTGKDKDRRK